MRDRIINQAATLIRSRGEAVGMREIAQASGIAVGSLYKHFSNKEALADALQSQALADLQRQLRMEQLNPGRPLLLRLESLAEAVTRVAPLLDSLDLIVDMLVDGLMPILTEARRRGESKSSVPLAKQARLIAWVLASTCWAHTRFGQTNDPEPEQALTALPSQLAAMIQQSLHVSNVQF